MQMNFDDVFDGAVQGKALLETRKAEIKSVGNGLPILAVSYVVIDSEPQGDSGLSANGEMINHTVWLPQDTDPADKISMKKKMVKRFLDAHGIDTSQNIDMEEVAQFLDTNRVQVGANCDVDQWALDNRDTLQTKIKSFNAV